MFDNSLDDGGENLLVGHVTQDVTVREDATGVLLVHSQRFHHNRKHLVIKSHRVWRTGDQCRSLGCQKHPGLDLDVLICR